MAVAKPPPEHGRDGDLPRVSAGCRCEHGPGLDTSGGQHPSTAGIAVSTEEKQIADHVLMVHPLRASPKVRRSIDRRTDPIPQVSWTHANRLQN